jgi:MYXO-CTERM domain-containing protein
MRKNIALLTLAFLIGLGLAPLGLQAQDPGTTGTSTYATNEEDEADWGWLGLLGLAGLAGLAGRKRHETTAYRDTTARTTGATTANR